MTKLIDAHGRVVRSLRLSVTDRCNLRCTYCMPASGIVVAPRRQLLAPGDYAFAVGVACDLGVQHLRLTGGEPLLRPDLLDIVRAIAAVSGLQDLALTTNGLLLSAKAQALHDAGVKRLNLSLDALDEQGFRRMTRRGGYDRVVAGLDAAVAAGFDPIRINVVALRGENEAMLEAWLDRTMDEPLDVRFLELMPMGEGAHAMEAGQFLDLAALRDRWVSERGLVMGQASRGNGPARYGKLPGARGSVGFITPLSDPYCDTCSRFRMTATGQLRPCLAEEITVDAREAILGRDADALGEAFRHAAASKPHGHRWQEGVTTPAGMSTLGG